MGLLVAGVIVAALLVWVVRPARRRGATAVAVYDGPSRLLAWAVDGLPADRAPWGEAMFGELHQMRGKRQRWRFAAGCAGATLLVPSRRANSAGLGARLVAATAIACASLVAYGLRRYPGVLAKGGTWPILAVFLAVLAGYTLIATVLVRQGPVARPGLAGGLGLAGVWGVAGIAAVSHPAYSALLLAIPLAALAVGAVAAGRSRTAAVRQQVVLLSAVVAGLVLFLALAGDTLLAAGGPYDAGQIRDFPGSGLPDMATYAVSDNLGTAMMLLLLVPVVTAAIGCAAAGITALLGRRGAPTS